MIPRLPRPIVIAILFVIFLGIAVFTKGVGANNENNNLLSVAAFLFGIFAAFSIANSQTKLNRINENIKSEEANLLFIYKITKSFGPKVQGQIKDLIDLYLIDQIDYYLKDYKYSNTSFLTLFDYLIELKPEGKHQEFAYDNVIGVLNDSAQRRKQIEAAVEETLDPLEWVSILVLLSLILFFIFYMNDGSLVSIATSALLSVASVVIVLVLRDLDSLRWKEQAWIWEPLESLFKSLELLPYYPKELVHGHRIKLFKGDRIRVATYPKGYPSMSGKVVEEIER